MRNYMLTPKEYPSDLDAKPFEIKDSRGHHIFLTIISTTLFSVSLYSMWSNRSWTDFPIVIISSLLLLLTIYCVTTSLRPKLIIKIDDRGIWTKKSGWTDWREIKYFYTKSFYTKGVINVQFFLKTNTREKEILVDLSFSEFANEGTIRRYIEIYRGDNKVIDLGKE
jgi:hypothetical protein